jgi:hypothetical protein
MADKCQGMFLWVNLQKDGLSRGLNRKKLELVVQTMPSGLERAYERNWTAILQSRDDRRSRALAILRWLYCAGRYMHCARSRCAKLLTRYVGNIGFPGLLAAQDMGR